MEGMEGMVGTSGRLGVCPRCGRTAELIMCPACNLEMIDCEEERYSDVYNDYRKARESGDNVDILLLERRAWQEHVFEHYIYKKGSEKYYEDAFERSSFIDKVCPFCDSLKTQKITFAEKFADFRSKGFKGEKRKREYHCDACNRDY